MVAQLLIVMIAAIGLTIFAERKGFQAPLFLAIVGMAVSFIPGLPRIGIEPEIILGLVLPPLLFSAAVNFSFFSFMKRLGSILNLGVLLVAVTAIAVGALLGIVLPVLSIPAALILGAVVAPTDAVSAIAIGNRLGLPARLMTVLKGESLINDAAALAIFSLAVAAATGAHSFISNGVLYFLFAAGFGAMLGVLLGSGVHALRRRLTNSTMVTAITVITPFAAYMLAEDLHMSGVMAVVFAGFALGHNSADLKFDGRIQEREFLNLVDALLEAFVFAYMGLQFRFVVTAAAEHSTDLWSLAGLSALTLLVVILIRIVWVLLSAVGSRWSHDWRLRRRGTPPSARRPLAEPLGWRENVVLSWSGMRGVVTVAAAAGTPLLTSAGTPLPGRDLIISIAFAVAVGTLILQGLTLPWLIHRLNVNNSADLVYRKKQMTLARQVMSKAAIDALEALKKTDASEADLALSERLMANAQRDLDAATDKTFQSDVHHGRLFEIVRDVQSARRGALIAERNAERLDDEIVRELLEDIDLEQAVVAKRSAGRTS